MKPYQQEIYIINLIPRDTWLDMDKVFDNFLAPTLYLNPDEAPKVKPEKSKTRQICIK